MKMQIGFRRKNRIGIIALLLIFNSCSHEYRFADSANDEVKQFSLNICNGDEKVYKLSDIFGKNIKKAYFIPANSYNLKQNNLPFIIPKAIIDCEMCSYLIILRDDGTVNYVYGSCKLDFINRDFEGRDDISIYSTDNMLVVRELIPESLISINYLEEDKTVCLNILNGNILELKESERYEW